MKVHILKVEYGIGNYKSHDVLSAYSNFENAKLSKDQYSDLFNSIDSYDYFNINIDEQEVK